MVYGVLLLEEVVCTKDDCLPYPTRMALSKTVCMATERVRGKVASGAVAKSTSSPTAGMRPLRAWWSEEAFVALHLYSSSVRRSLMRLAFERKYCTSATGRWSAAAMSRLHVSAEAFAPTSACRVALSSVQTIEKWPFSSYRAYICGRLERVFVCAIS